MLGNARSDLGMVEPAVEAYRRALVLSHQDAWTMNSLGIALERSGYPAEAAVAFRAALESNPGHARAGANLERVEPLAAKTTEPWLDRSELADAIAAEIRCWAEAESEEGGQASPVEAEEDEYDC